MKHRENKSMVKTFQNVYEYLKKCGHKPILNIMDNECSVDLKRDILKISGSYELVPPHHHRRDVAEKSIRILGLTRTRRNKSSVSAIGMLLPLHHTQSR